MDSPDNYKDVCDKALQIKVTYNLTDTQTLLYNHVCRKDFYLCNEDGQLFYDENSKGFGWSGSREWVKKQFQPLVKENLVKFSSKKAPRSGRYKIWYWHDPNTELSDLIDGANYVTVYKFFILKKYLNLPDGFDRNGNYGDIRFIKDTQYLDKDGLTIDQITDKCEHYYSFCYKEIPNHQLYNTNQKGEVTGIYSSLKLNQKDWRDSHYFSESFSELIHELWKHIQYRDKVNLCNIRPDSTNKRYFTIDDSSR